MENILRMEGVKLVFRNFRGEGGEYNAPGDRNCHVVIPPEMVEVLTMQGWNVRLYQPKDESIMPFHILKFNISYKIPALAPKVFGVRGNNTPVPIPEDVISSLDYQTFTNVDLEIRPYKWTKGGRSGISAYLSTGYFVMEEDYLAQKYGN